MHMLLLVSTSKGTSEFTFQQLRADVIEFHFLPQVALVQLPDAGDEGVLLGRAAGNPTVHLLKV